MIKTISCVALYLLMSLFDQTLAQKSDAVYRDARKKGAEACVVVKVEDDKGTPVVGATVHVLMGMNFRTKSYFIDGVTDTNGTYIVKGKTTGNEIEIVVSKTGWYESVQKLCFSKMGEEHEVKDGKWQPWEAEVPMRIRRVVNPVRLICKHEFYTIPVVGKAIGFDMEKSDWTAPYGHGERSDFYVTLSWDGKPMYDTRQTELAVSFQGDRDGYYEYSNVRGCAFGGAYAADPRHHYEKSMTCSSKRIDGVPTYTGVRPGCSLVVRSRCRVDAEGHLVSANYSTIRAVAVEGEPEGIATMLIRYFYNPTPNDTNLEPAR